ncbi:MAG: zinc-binding dehydrogenase [Dehalococcoidia bacterium]
MKAVVFHEHGGTDQLHLEEVAEPSLAASECLIRVRAAGCNYNDIWARRGLPGMKIILPHVSGSDAAGEVAAVGPEVRSLKVGQRVMVHPGLSCRICQACTSGNEMFCRDFKIWGFQTGPNDGAYAEMARLPEANLLPIPESLSFEEAASLPLVLETTWRMLVTRAQIAAGDVVLIWGGAGGLGVMAIQVCRLWGAVPVAVVSSDEKAGLARSLGATHVIDRTKEDVVARTREITGRRGVDIVFEHVGDATWPQSAAALKWGGTIVVCGGTTGFNAATDLRFLWNKQQNYLGSHLGTKAELVEALRFVSSGQIKPVVDQVFPLGEAAQAQTRMESDAAAGKLILVP